MKALECHVAFTTCNILLGQLMPELTPPTLTLAYKKAAKKVHPVAALLPEDF